MLVFGRVAGRSTEEFLGSIRRLLGKLGLRCKAKRLLQRLEARRTSERFRPARALQVLETIGTAEARRALGRLAGGAREADLTRAARAALERLNRRAGGKR